MTNPIWIDVTTTDRNPLVLNAAFIVGISVAPRADKDGGAPIFDQTVIYMSAAIYPGGASVYVQDSVAEVRAKVAKATSKAD